MERIQRREEYMKQVTKQQMQENEARIQRLLSSCTGGRKRDDCESVRLRKGGEGDLTFGDLGLS